MADRSRSLIFLASRRLGRLLADTLIARRGRDGERDGAWEGGGTERASEAGAINLPGRHLELPDCAPFCSSNRPCSPPTLHSVEVAVSAPKSKRAGAAMSGRILLRTSNAAAIRDRREGLKHKHSVPAIRQPPLQAAGGTSVAAPLIGSFSRVRELPCYLYCGAVGSSPNWPAGWRRQPPLGASQDHPRSDSLPLIFALAGRGSNTGAVRLSVCVRLMKPTDQPDARPRCPVSLALFGPVYSLLASRHLGSRADGSS